MSRINSDGTDVMCPNLFPDTCAYVAAGRGDSPTEGRCKGDAFIFYSDPEKGTSTTYPPQTFTLNFSFNDVINMAGGTVSYDGASPGDTIDLRVSAPASTVVASAGQTGDCNLVALGGGASMIVPAAGNGAYTLQSAVPVPSYDDTPDMELNGYWECCDPEILAQGITPSPSNCRLPNQGKGNVVPSSVPGKGTYSLYSFSTILERFMVEMPMHASRTLRFTPQIKPKAVLPCWVFTATLFNSGHAGLSVSWVLELGRIHTC